MKNARLTSILNSSLVVCALSIGTLVSAHSASAQSNTVLAEVNIPFAFQTGTQTLPAGTYRINRQSSDIVLLRGPNHAIEFVMVYGKSKPRSADHGSVVFDRAGDKYFLRQIWTAQSTNGLECRKSRAEKTSVLAKNKQAPSSIEVAFNSVPQP